MTLNLRIDPFLARVLLNGIIGCRFPQGLRRYFIINPEGTVDEESICWLYMWATAGWNRSNTAAQVRHVWNRIFELPIECLNPTEFKPIAKRIRDTKTYLITNLY